MTQLQLVEPTEPDLATFEDQIEALARDIELTTALSAWRIGESLARARDLHKYKRGSSFGNWTKARLGWDETYARRFINVFEQIPEAKSGQLSRLSSSALLAYSAPSTDDSIRDEVERRLAEGQKVTAAQIEALKREAAEQKRRADDLALGKSEADQHAAAAAARLRDLEAKDREKSSVDIDAIAKKMEADYRAEADRKDREIAELRKKLAAASAPPKAATSATVLAFNPKGLTEGQKAEIDAEGDAMPGSDFDQKASPADRATFVIGAIYQIATTKADPKLIYRQMTKGFDDSVIAQNKDSFEHARNLIDAVLEKFQ